MNELLHVNIFQEVKYAVLKMYGVLELTKIIVESPVGEMNV
jgi:hypothetical protein